MMDTICKTLHEELYWYKLPELVSKHLKLLSQNPQTMMISLSGMAAKQEVEAERLWSRGSPSRAFKPTAVHKAI